jgi:hypothetical protein
METLRFSGKSTPIIQRTELCNRDQPIYSDPCGANLQAHSGLKHAYTDFRWLATRYGGRRDDVYLFTDMAVMLDGIARKAAAPS